MKSRVMNRLLVFFVLLCNSYAIIYDSYHGTAMSKEEFNVHEKANTILSDEEHLNCLETLSIEEKMCMCTNDIEPCDLKEGRRIDGSCNNLNNPSKGTRHTPLLRVLPANFDKDFEPRKAMSGNDLPLARRLRTRLLSVGSVPSQRFTQLAMHFILFITGNIVSQHDTLNYVYLKPYCCTTKGKSDHACVPNKIPHDDPVHRFSDMRCLNMTRPQSFQSVGCIGKGTTPERIVSTTSLLDLSTVYGSSAKELQNFRMFVGGFLKFELANGKIWPPSYKNQVNVCLLNNRQTEKRCHHAPDFTVNTLVGKNLVFIWFWRLHNAIAEELSKVNPGWNDQKLFDTAREINIAVALQIYYYEMLPLLLGKDNLKRDGVITSAAGFRDIYNPAVMPQMSLEYPYVLRWLHTLQEGSLKMYNTDGAYMKQIPIVNLTLRTGYFDVDDNMIYITQGSFRQAGANADYIVDPDIAEMGLGPLQKASDLATNDLAKSRYFGLEPYIKYREFCFGKPVRNWDDLNGAIDPQRIEILKSNYENIEDIDLLAGIWLEKHIPGGSAPSTFYCLVKDQLLRNVVSDRHWYERPNRPNAFSDAQLQEIRKVTIAGVLCKVGDSVAKIQHNAFSLIGPNNNEVDCSEINSIDFSMWKDLK